MSREDLEAMRPYKNAIDSAARATGTKPHILAGIMSRESNGGRTLDSRGYGTDGYGYGLMQVDKRWHTLQGGPYSVEHIRQAAGLLRSFTDEISAKHPSWSSAQKKQGGIAAYNCGARGVTDPNNLDANTYQQNYSRDVLQRADFFRRNGYN